MHSNIEQEIHTLQVELDKYIGQQEQLLNTYQQITSLILQVRGEINKLKETKRMLEKSEHNKEEKYCQTNNSTNLNLNKNHKPLNTTNSSVINNQKPIIKTSIDVRSFLEENSWRIKNPPETPETDTQLTVQHQHDQSANNESLESQEMSVIFLDPQYLEKDRISFYPSTGEKSWPINEKQDSTQHISENYQHTQEKPVEEVETSSLDSNSEEEERESIKTLHKSNKEQRNNTVNNLAKCRMTLLRQKKRMERGKTTKTILCDLCNKEEYNGQDPWRGCKSCASAFISMKCFKGKVNQAYLCRKCTNQAPTPNSSTSQK